MRYSSSRTTPFRELREHIWLDVLGRAAEEDVPGVIFTLVFEPSLLPGFFDRLRERVESVGGSLHPFELTLLDSRRISVASSTLTARAFSRATNAELPGERACESRLRCAEVICQGQHCDRRDETQCDRNRAAYLRGVDGRELINPLLLVACCLLLGSLTRLWCGAGSLRCPGRCSRCAGSSRRPSSSSSSSSPRCRCALRGSGRSRRPRCSWRWPR